MACETFENPGPVPGTRREHVVCRFGAAGARPKAFIQASTHADELAAILCADHLRRLLEEADAAGRIRGEVVLVPAANPAGLAQVALGHHVGRYHLPSGRNFNRAWPDGTPEVMARRQEFGADAAENGRRVREIVGRWLEGREARGEDAAHKLFLMKLAHDADLVLDLHTDLDSELHLYIDPDHWPGLADLAGLLDARVVMLARHSGGAPFEESVAAPFIALREAGVAVDLPVTVTVELRGRQDVSDELAARDAAALFDFLVLRGVISGEASAPAFSGVAAPLEATAHVFAPEGGVIVYRRELGARVEAGEVIAEILDPFTGRRVPARTPASGRLFTRNLSRLAQAGDSIAKVQGETPLSDRRKGALMLD